MAIVRKEKASERQADRQHQEIPLGEHAKAEHQPEGSIGEPGRALRQPRHNVQGERDHGAERRGVGQIVMGVVSEDVDQREGEDRKSGLALIY